MVTTSRFKQMLLIVVCASIFFQAQAGFWDSCKAYTHSAYDFIKNHTMLTGLAISSAVVASMYYIKNKSNDCITFEEMPYLKQFKVTPQQGSSCGYHSIGNSKAIAQLVKQGKPLTAHNINHYAGEISMQRENEKELTANEMLQYMNYHELNDAYMVMYFEKNISLAQIEPEFGVYPYENEKYADQDLFALEAEKHQQQERQYNTLLEQYKNDRKNAPDVAHFMCYAKLNPEEMSSGYHWVAVSVVKDEKNNLSMIYTDSLNRELKDDSIRYAMVKKLYEAIFHTEVKERSWKERMQNKIASFFKRFQKSK